MTIPLLLHGRHTDERVLYQPFGPWMVPWRYTTTESEYEALRRGVGLLDYSIYSLIEVRGADRVSFLHNLLSNDIKRLKPGQGCHAAFLSPTAKLIASLLVLVDANLIWLLCDTQQAVALTQTLEGYHFSEEITLINHERSAALLALEGLRTIVCLTQLVGAVVALPDPDDHAVVSCDGLTMRFIRQSITGETGVLCLVDAKSAPDAWQRFRNRGLSCGLQLVGWEALNIARIEAGIPWCGIDLDESTLLPETGLERIMASDTKGCYVGQEIVARVHTYGSVSRKLVGLRLPGDHVPETGDHIVRGEEECGSITSACMSVALRCPIALGYVKRGAYEPGMAVEIISGGGRLPATVSALPFGDTSIFPPRSSKAK